MSTVFRKLQLPLGYLESRVQALARTLTTTATCTWWPPSSSTVMEQGDKSSSRYTTVLTDNRYGKTTTLPGGTAQIPSYFFSKFSTKTDFHLALKSTSAIPFPPLKLNFILYHRIGEAGTLYSQCYPKYKLGPLLGLLCFKL